MLMITERQEDIFKLFDEVIDRGDCVKSFISNNEAIRKRINRNFHNLEGRSKVDTAMYMYGFDDFSGTPTPIEIQRSIYITDEYTVEIDAAKFIELKSIYNISENDLRRLFRPYLQKLKLDSLDIFISSIDADEFSYSLLRGFSELRYATSIHFSSMDELRSLYNIDIRLRNYSRDYSKFNLFTSLGNEFESILRKLDFIGGSDGCKHNPKIGNCRPDFVVGNSWIDAKLSKSTALNYGDETIRKYTKHTDDLTIVYALDDGVDVSNIEREYNVTFKHVSEYYDNASEEAIAEVKEFIKKASSIKGVQS